MGLTSVFKAFKSRLEGNIRWQKKFQKGDGLSQIRRSAVHLLFMNSVHPSKLLNTQTLFSYSAMNIWTRTLFKKNTQLPTNLKYSVSRLCKNGNWCFLNQINTTKIINVNIEMCKLSYHLSPVRRSFAFSSTNFKLVEKHEKKHASGSTWAQPSCLPVLAVCNISVGQNSSRLATIHMCIQLS